MREYFKHYGSGYLIAIVSVSVTGLFRYAFAETLGETASTIPFVIPTILSAWYGGLRPGLLATALSTMVSNYLFVPPQFSLMIESWAEGVALLLFIISGVTISGLCESLRNAGQRAELYNRQLTEEIEERRRAEAVANESEDRLRRFMNNSQVAAFLKDSAGRYVYVNQMVEKKLHRPAADWIGKTDADIFSTEDARQYRTNDQHVLESGTAIEFEETVETATGRQHFLSFKFPFLGKDGQLLLGGTSLDITAIKHIEAGLRAERERVQFVADAVPALISYVDTEAHYQLNNRAYERWFGLPRGELVGKHMKDVLGENAWRAIQPYVEEALAGRVVRYEAEVPYREGGTRWINATYTPDVDERGVVRGFVAHVNDITARKEVEKELRRRVEEFEVLMELMPIAVIRADDPECVQLTGNPTAHKLLKVPHDRKISMPPSFDDHSVKYRMFKDGVEVPPSQLPMQLSCSSGVEVRDAEYDIVYDTGEVQHIYCYATPLFDEPGRVRGCLFAALDITERKKIENALRQAEERFRASQEASLFGFTILAAVRNDDGQVVDFEWEYVNPAAAAIFNQPTSHLKGKRFLDVLPNQGLTADLFNRYVRVVETGEPHDYELHYKDAGTDGWFRTMAVRLGDGLAVSFYDVTARRRAEQQREEALMIVNGLVSAAPLGIALLDTEMRFRLVNGPLARMNGLAIADHLGKTIAEVVPEIYPKVETVFRQVIENGQAIADSIIEGVRASSVGKKRIWKESWFPVAGPDGKSTAVGLIVQDITEERHAANRLRTKTARLHLLAEAADVLLHAVDPTVIVRTLYASIRPHLGLDVYMLFLVNEQSHALQLASSTGVPPEFVRQFSDIDFGPMKTEATRSIPPGISDSRLQKLNEVLTEFVNSEFLKAYTSNSLISNDRLLGMLFFGSRSREQFDALELEFLQTICHYLTAAYERDQFVQKMRDADRRKDEFLATLAHELRNPLAPISNAVQVLKGQSMSDPVMRSASEIIERQVKHIVHLIGDLLDISRITLGKVELKRRRVSLNSVVDQAVETVRSLAEAAGHKLTINLPSQPIDLDADPTRLAQVLGNLLNNACKYTENGGQISLSAVQELQEVVVSVRDNGIGIAAEHIPPVFEKFSQVDPVLERSQGGLGIGLSLVKGLVEMHGGTVEVRSEGRGHGSEFIVRLPVFSGQETAPQPDSQSEAGVKPVNPASARRILVVDDNRDSAESLAIFLQMTGNEVQTAFDGLEAVEKAEQFRPELILMDIGMPRLNGYEACRRIRSQCTTHKMVLIALTGWGGEGDRQRTEEAGFDGHFVKPVDPSLLTKLLESLARA